MLLWLLLTITTDPSLDLPPVEDPVGRLIATIVAVAIPVSAVAVARIQAKKAPGHSPLPLPGVDSPTPRMDLGQEYLAKFVQHLENSDRLTNAKYDDLNAKYLDLLEKYATISARYEVLRVEANELRNEVHVLRGRVQGRGNG